MTLRAHVVATAGRLELDVELETAARPVALVGPNGSGKTTLLRALVGAIRPRSGFIEVAGSVLFSHRDSVDVPMERRRVGYVPQGYGLFPHLSVLDNVSFGLRQQGSDASATEVTELLDLLEIAHLADRLPRRLSGGEQQRVALARALAVRPALLLLDEPTASLDATHRRSVRRLLAERLAKDAPPSVVVTHDARDVATLDAHVYVLEHGRVVQQGDLESLRAAPATDFVAEFAGV